MANARTAKSTREKAAALRLEQERQAGRRRRLTVGVAVLLVLAVLIGAFVLVRTLKNQQDAKAAAASKAPAHLYTTGTGVTGVLYGKESAKVTVTMYEDFQCPNCKNFEDRDKALLRSDADQGKIKLVYVPVAILDTPTKDYSTRAASAAAAVVNAAPDRFIAFHDALYAAQPAESSAGLSDSQLLDLAAQAGVDRSTVQAAVTGHAYSGWVTTVTNTFDQKYPGTPTVLINGTQAQSLDPTALQAAITAAVG